MQRLFQLNLDLDFGFNPAANSSSDYYIWWQYGKFINAVTDEIIIPYQEECRTGKQTPRTDTLLLYLLCDYVSHEESLSLILRRRPSKISMIKGRIEKAAAY